MLLKMLFAWCAEFDSNEFVPILKSVSDQRIILLTNVPTVLESRDNGGNKSALQYELESSGFA